MKIVLTRVFNWHQGLSGRKKIIWGLVGIFFALSLIIALLATLLMLISMLVPFIAIMASIVFLVLSLINKNKSNEYWKFSLTSIAIAFASTLAMNTFDSPTHQISHDSMIEDEAISLESPSNNLDELDSINATPEVNDSQGQVEEIGVPIVNESQIHFINTGNSDAILIENNGDFAMIDTGDTDDDLTVKSYLQNQGVEKLDYLILTHFHADHIGSADTVISDFEVEKTLVPNGDADTQVYKDYINALFNKGLQPSVPLEGSKFELGSATLTLYNTEGGSSNENNNSLVVLYENGEDRALFMGDAESEVESKLSIGEVDLLKVGHHGSNTSSSELFINNIQPEYAVILAGQPNQYGHPNQETLELLKTKGILVYRTDEQGDIIFVSSGEGFNTELNAGSYKAGQVNDNTSYAPQTQSDSGDGSSSVNSSINSSSSQSSLSIINEDSSPSVSSNNTINYKDDNPNGMYNQESVGQKETYKNCTLLREVYPDGVPQGHPAYSSKHDRDKDGWACER